MTSGAKNSRTIPMQIIFKTIKPILNNEFALDVPFIILLNMFEKKNI